jgi:hypothetical protein
MNQLALQMIESALNQLVQIGRKTENLRLIVSNKSALTQCDRIHTTYGELRITVSQYVPRGYSYIMEIPTCGRARGFRWVSRPKQTLENVK